MAEATHTHTHTHAPRCRCVFWAPLLGGRGNCCFNGAVGSTVSIGKNCDISDYVHFVTGTHEINTKESGLRRAGKGCFKNIEIGDNVWIGYRVTILPGVKIGDGAIIGAGCVVYKNVLEGELIVSNSAIKKWKYSSYIQN